MKKQKTALGWAEWHKGMADAVARAAERLELYIDGNDTFERNF